MAIEPPPLGLFAIWGFYFICHEWIFSYLCGQLQLSDRHAVFNFIFWLTNIHKDFKLK